MFRITATEGLRSRNVLANSHASHASISSFPVRPFAPMSGRRPPITADVSISAPSSICVIMEVVVVLPCVPHTPITLPNLRVTAPNSLLRSNVGTPMAFAATSSGLSGRSAAVYTTISASPMFSAFWPRTTGIPSLRIRFSVSVSLLSEPESIYPF